MLVLKHVAFFVLCFLNNILKFFINSVFEPNNM